MKQVEEEIILLKRKTACKYFVQDCLKVLLLVFIPLKMLRNSKNDELLVGQKRNLSIWSKSKENADSKE